jgi:uncharacterized membrane protein
MTVRHYVLCPIYLGGVFPYPEALRPTRLHPEQESGGTMATIAEPGESGVPQSFVAPCRSLHWTAPLRWVRLGWNDLTRAPRQSLSYGLVLSLLSVSIAVLSWLYGTLALYLGLATGFMFVGPVVALAVYSISWQLEAGRKPALGYCLRDGWMHVRDILLFGLVLMVVLLVWARAATMLHVFFPNRGEPTLRSLLPFLGIGSAVGAVFSSIVFSASAFSLPMMLDRKADAVTAVVTSVNAVLANKAAMLVWGTIIVAAVLAGFATGMVAFVVLLPLIGHATWHGYRETIDASAWPAWEHEAQGSPSG